MPALNLRLASLQDVPALEALIPLAVHQLQAGDYTQEQREAALGPVFGVDRQLITDGTYFLVETEGREVVACGGWSRRRTLFGGDASRQVVESEADKLEPQVDAARIRAFFVHPQWARRGLGRRLLSACENAAMEQGFQRGELVATLAGEPLYAEGGFAVVERFEVPLAGGLMLPVVKMSKEFAHSLLVSDSKMS